MITATPRLAVLASSWMIGISISRMVRKPAVSVARATLPGMNRRRKQMRAAAEQSAPSQTWPFSALIICTPWDTPMAKTRNGTRIDSGSMPKPNSTSSPSCQTTATSEQTSGRMVSRLDREYR